ncbi:MAG TPA: TIR domain-containing protein [Allosphingosinicella sp.]|nr:TIR domain-containing protein [Allosphingosinicella sp.]
MAGIFLSYAREDAAKAEALAKALERAGHQVWWDRHVQSGSRFAKQIDQELEAADAVLVLWSCSSVESAWVQDEAAEGRDTNRLIPAMIDGCKPPLGFRQYQSVDMSGWTGRRKLPPQLLEAISTIANGGSAVTNAGDVGEAGEPKPRGRVRMWAAAIGLLLLAGLLFGGWWYVDSGFPGNSETPTLAVLPFADLSPQRDKGYFAEGVAESILSLLGREEGIKVIGRTSAWQFKDGSADLPTIRRALGVTHVLEGSTRTAGDQLRLSVRLIDATDGSQVWSEDYQRKLSNVFAVQDEIGRAVAKRLAGSLSSNKAPQSLTTRADAYTLYLAARAEMRDRKEPALRKALGLAKQALASDPDYAPAHALYAELIFMLSDAPNSYGSIPQDKARAVALQHARKAIAIAPNAPEGYAALGVVSPPKEGIEPLRRAIAADPARAEVRVWLSLHLEELGRNEEAFQQVRAAAEIEPLWTVPINRLSFALAASGRFEESEQVIQTYLQRGGDPAQAARFRSSKAVYAGDLSEAVRQGRLAVKLAPTIPFVRSYLEGLYAVLGLPQLIEWEAPERNRVISWMVAKGQKAGLRDTLREQGADVWKSRDAGLALAVLAEAREWALISQIYKGRWARAVDLCDSADRTTSSGMIQVIVALLHTGQREDALQLMSCYENYLLLQAQGPYRSPFYGQAELSFRQAQLLALRGRTEQALAALEQAVTLGWRGYPHSAQLASYPALDSLRPNPAYARVQRRLDRFIAAERDEVLRQEGKASTLS